MAIGVILADDHGAYREGLARAIQADPRLELLAQVANGVEAVEAIGRLRPDVAVVDLKMPGLDGFEVCSQAAESLADQPTRVVLIVGTPSGALMTRAAEIGAAALLGKEASRAEICDRVVAVARS